MWKTTTNFDFMQTGPSSREMPTVLEGSETDAKWLLFRAKRLELQEIDEAGFEVPGQSWDDYAADADQKSIARLWNTESAARQYVDYNAELNILGITSTFDGEVDVDPLDLINP